MRVTAWAIFVVAGLVGGASTEYLMGGHLDNGEPSRFPREKIEPRASLRARTSQLDDLDLDLEAEESTASSESEGKSPHYRIPYSFAFNGGMPFSLEKDPITGKIDFEKAPPVKALNYTDRYQEGAKAVGEEEQNLYENGGFYDKENDGEDVGPNEVNPYSPNFHDFLNLPVHYSSDKYGKDKYPLISSSYANTKVQSGSNSYNTYNHRPYHRETTHHYYPTRKPYLSKSTVESPTTRSTTVEPSKPPAPTTVSTTTVKTPVTRTTTMRTTIRTTMRTTTIPSSSTTTTTEAATSTTKAPAVTTWKPSSTSAVRYTEHTKEFEEDIKPVVKLQSSEHSKDKSTPNTVVPFDREESEKPPSGIEDYGDGYEEYDIIDDGERDYFTVKEPTKESMKEESSFPSTVLQEETPVSTKATMSVSSTTTTTRPPTIHLGNVFASNPLHLQVYSKQPVTSMPLDNEESKNQEKILDLHKLSGPPIGYRPLEATNQRPSLGMAEILVESTSNVVVPPDQDTVSFVLGNRQNVEGGYYTVGTAIGESPYGGPSALDRPFRPVHQVPDQYDSNNEHREVLALPSVSVVENDPGVQQWWSHAPPLVQKNANEVELPTRSSFPKGGQEEKDERKEEKDSNFVVFPKVEKPRRPVEEHVLIVNEADGSIREVVPSPTGLKSTVEPSTIDDDRLPQLADSLTPPAKQPKPPTPFYYHYQHGGTSRPDHSRPPRPLLPPRGKQPPPPPSSSSSSAIGRRPYVPDSKLPNILPQFRPNAKTSHGHRGPESIGTIPAAQVFSTRVRPPLQSHPPPSRRPVPPPPSYLQRLNPPPPPIHTLRLSGAPSSKVENVVSPHEVDPMVKRFRSPSGASGSRIDDDKSTHVTRPSNQKPRHEEEDRIERYSEEPPQVPPRPPLFPKRRTADPPRVTTLQMIQQHGELADEPADLEATASERILIDSDRRKSEEPPVYVVYPVNTAVNIHPDDSGERDETVVVGTRGPQRPLPPETLLQDDEKFAEEGTAGGQKVLEARPMAHEFPYHLERPEPPIFGGPVRETPLLVPSEKNARPSHDNEDVNVIPYLQDFVPFPARRNEPISATLHRAPPVVPTTPIAYAYTPAVQGMDDKEEEEEVPLVERNEHKPVLLPSQQPSSSSSSAPSPQNFMAPFVASLSAEEPVKNGWNVVETSIDRVSEEQKHEDVEKTENERTERTEFDVENFKPQLFGGFKPIYEFPVDDAVRPEETAETTATA
ncbi:hypothetical protein KM043_009048 [Ampulex compressa]|nr:hypothetical protein KM043_009048 [Ampulex compressa]